LSLINTDVKTMSRRPEKRFWWGDSPMVPSLLTLVVIFILFSLFIRNFGTIRTVAAVVNAASINAIVVIGVTLLMISGEFDLSVGATVAMGGYIFATTMLKGGSPIAAVGLALLVTAMLGAINGGLTIWTGIPSFIVTLGTSSIYRAAVWLYSGGLMLQTTDELSLYTFFSGRLDIVNNLFRRANFQTATVWVIGLGLLFQFILIRTRFGNHVFATGGNPRGAKAQGINTKRVKLICFTLTGTLAGLAGIMTFSQFLTVFVATGRGVELTAIASAVVGGALLKGGVGSIIGGLVGILLISVLRSGAVLLGLPSDNFEAIVGIAIIGAAIINERVRSHT
jgi:simple sugar transport system permease protein